ncbi:hypothetical protein Ppa06_65290 [Planomonospora parontospora subsp. parontospora]|uniref:Uncharacterized protein n=2 Tax=Planomonospora parontospora TaxID=58119 RepID=A0AA37BNE6_9ACTN|nr:hypothetical protein GCM10010126_65430 [Planomonospora parontospora]GII12731.1 hypothetical protein Ppa06_65290 [Planomonospora parontospora subsp. parontospora]
MRVSSAPDISGGPGGAAAADGAGQTTAGGGPARACPAPREAARWDTHPQTNAGTSTAAATADGPRGRVIALTAFPMKPRIGLIPLMRHMRMGEKGACRTEAVSWNRGPVSYLALTPLGD